MTTKFSSFTSIAAGVALDTDELVGIFSGDNGRITLTDLRVIPDGGTIGQAAGPLLTFDDTNNYLKLAGAYFLVNTTNPNLFTGAYGQTKSIVTGNSSETNPISNNNACFVISNTNDTTDNTAALHFAWEDLDNNAHYAGASIVAQMGAKTADQYPSTCRLHFLTSPAGNNSPQLRMSISEAGVVKVASLAGIGSRNVVVDADGNMSAP